MSTRGNSEEIFAMTRAFFRGVKLENRPSISDFRKMAILCHFHDLLTADLSMKET